VRCGRCGNENADTNRFCGMCGAPLSAPVQTATAQPARSASTQQGTQHPMPSLRPAATAQAEPGPSGTQSADDAPIISGPSILGLNKPRTDGGRTGAQRPAQDQVLDQLRSSRNLDYLLDDEEEPKSSAGKWLLILVALALALGFGYLRWRQGGFDWLTAGLKKPATAENPQNEQSPANSNENPAAATPASAPGTTPAEGSTPAGANGTSSAPNQPAAPAPGAAATSSAANPAAAPSGSSAAPESAANSPAENGAAPASSAAGGNVPATAPATGAPTPAHPTQSASSPAKPSTDDAGPASQPQAAAEKPAAAAQSETPSEPAPVVKPTPAKPVDPVAQAEKYIYGRGVHQNCDRGLDELKSAADRSNPKAMISLGALYATGVCAPRDLPTAYRWFALALRKEPDNDELQDNMQRIWSQMTQPERQLAIKLSQ